VAGPLPVGDPAPEDGHLPASALASTSPLSAYVHVPYCRVRCGYCDFNTYTASELGDARRDDYSSQVAREIEFAARVLGPSVRPFDTVFLGGGTPTLLPAADLVTMLDALRTRFGIADGAEVTVEANPDSVDAEYLHALKAGGFTRVSFGVQSAVPHVLATLDRTHDPERVPEVVAWAKEAGLDTSIDLIYGTPGESVDDWRQSLDFALSLDTGHISAYALIVEEGTALERRIRRGDIEPTDDDLMADMYELAESKLSEAGFSWYEVSNWARSTREQSRHNLAYWLNNDWWGFGPGAHSHVGGLRWWNVKHPHAYAQRVNAGVSPAAGRETPDAQARELEEVLLRMRLASGLPIQAIDDVRRADVQALVGEGLIDPAAYDAGNLILTSKGRLLADYVVRRLTD
jgi:oxygen-independent coproporphyrinogen-3 oxidase